MTEGEQHAGEQHDERNPQIADANELNPAGGRNGGGRSSDTKERQQPDQPVDQHDRRRERLGAGVRRGVRDADDVAANIAGEKVVEERGHQEGPGEVAEPDVDLLSLQEQAPSPGARGEHRCVGNQRCGSPLPAHVCELVEEGTTVGTAQQEREQAYTYDDLEDRQRGLHPEKFHGWLGSPGVRRSRGLEMITHGFRRPDSTGRGNDEPGVLDGKIEDD